MAIMATAITAFAESHTRRREKPAKVFLDFAHGERFLQQSH
jgi:hypothetical protein